MATDGTLVVDHPFESVDEAGTLFPLHLSLWGQSGGYVVYSKHVLYSWIVGGLYQQGGLAAVLVLSSISSLGAALGTARIAERLNPKAAIPALWLAGFGSPLLFDSAIGYAHSLAAAGLAWATWALLTWLHRPRQTLSGVGLLILAGALLFGIAQTRTEAPLAGLALTAALFIGFAPLTLLRASVASAVAGSATIGGLFVDRWTAIPTTGHVVIDPRTTEWGFLDGRVAAFVNTWLTPGRQPADMLVLVSATLLLAACALARRRRRMDPLPGGLLAVSALLAVIRLTLSPAPLVPGLLMAAPILFGGLIVLERPADASKNTTATLRSLGLGFGLFCLAVLATEYPYGGVAEWGGRYFAVGLPLGLALAAVGGTEWMSRLDRSQLRPVLGLVSIGVLALNLAGVAALRQGRTSSGQLSAAAASLASQAVHDDFGAVTVSLVPLVPRLAWEQLDQGRWLLATPDDLALLAQRLDEAGIASFVLVTFADEDLAALDGHYRPRSDTSQQVGSISLQLVEKNDTD